MRLTVNDDTEYILRSSHGKDSLKCLDVIVGRGLPLDRITTTDVWATETIRGELAEMVKFKDYVDGYIWEKYRIEVEHLCAMKNGEKVTYEKMFYHIPKRKNAGGTARNPERFLDSRHDGALGANQLSKYDGNPKGWPMQKGPWCQKLKHIWVPGIRQTRHLVPEAQDQVFKLPPHEGQDKYRGISGHCGGRAGTIPAA